MICSYVILDLISKLETSSQSVSDAVSDVESQLKHKGIVGVTQVDRRGFDQKKEICWSSPAERQKRDLLL